MQCGANTNVDCVTVLQQMLQSGKYYPTMTWIQPIGGGGLDHLLGALCTLAVDGVLVAAQRRQNVHGVHRYALVVDIVLDERPVVRLHQRKV